MSTRQYVLVMALMLSLWLSDSRLLVLQLFGVNRLDDEFDGVMPGGGCDVTPGCFGLSELPVRCTPAALRCSDDSRWFVILSWATRTPKAQWRTTDSIGL